MQEALDVIARDGGDREATHERLDMTFDPAPVHRQRAGFLRSLTPRQQTAGLDIGEVGIAELGNRGRLPRSALLSRGIGARDHFTEDASGLCASALRRPRRAVAPDRVPTLAPAGCPILDEVAHRVAL